MDSLHDSRSSSATVGKLSVSENKSKDIVNKGAEKDMSTVLTLTIVVYKKYDDAKKTVESMTDLKVLEVNVHVQGVRQMAEKEVEEPETEQNANENENQE